MQREWSSMQRACALTSSPRCRWWLRWDQRLPRWERCGAYSERSGPTSNTTFTVIYPRYMQTDRCSGYPARDRTGPEAVGPLFRYCFQILHADDNGQAGRTDGTDGQRMTTTTGRMPDGRRTGQSTTTTDDGRRRHTDGRTDGPTEPVTTLHT